MRRHLRGYAKTSYGVYKIEKQLWGYKVEDKLHLGVRQEKKLIRPVKGIALPFTSFLRR
jgi:hypothetical protein